MERSCLHCRRTECLGRSVADKSGPFTALQHRATTSDGSRREDKHKPRHIPPQTSISFSTPTIENLISREALRMIHMYKLQGKGIFLGCV